MSTDERELERVARDGSVTMAAPNSVGEGTIIVYPDILSMDVQTETARDVKERPWMRVDPTAPGLGAGDEDLAFPYAFRQGVYVALSSKNQGGSAVEVPDDAIDRTAAAQSAIALADASYAVPWSWATIDNFEARPVVGRAAIGTVKRVRRGVARVLSGKLGAGDIGRGDGGR